MAAALLVLVILNAAATGWLLCRVRALSRDGARLGDICTSLLQAHSDLESRIPDVWDGACG